MRLWGCQVSEVWTWSCSEPPWSHLGESLLEKEANTDNSRAERGTSLTTSLTPHLEPAKPGVPEFFCFKDPIILLSCLRFQVGFYSFQLRIFTNIRTLHLEKRKRDALLVTPGIPEGMSIRTDILHFLHSAPSEPST